MTNSATNLNIKAAIDVINGYIRECEAPYETGTNSKMYLQYKRECKCAIFVCLEVLSALTGCTYRWDNYTLDDGKKYSGVIRLDENGNEVEVYDNAL